MKRPVLLLALALAACSSKSNSADGGTTSGTTAGSGSTSGSTGTGTSTGTSTGTATGSTGSTGSLDGGAHIPGLSADVTVSYDSRDIPHVHCGSLVDCIRVQGYLHAQDRLFEMDFYRHLSEGRLMEMTGEIEAARSYDTTFKTLFITRDGQRIESALTNALDPDTRALLQAYADGVSAFIGQVRSGAVAAPYEYGSLFYSPAELAAIEDWRIEDTLAVGRLQQFALSETIEQETDYGQMYASMTPDELAALVHARQIYPAYTVPGFPFGQVPPPRARAHAKRAVPASFKPGLDQLAARLSDLRRVLAAPGFTGSNNWVVDGAHSASGKAMVANDPHLALDYPPNFHLSHLTADAEGIDLLGATFPAVPGVLTGRSTHVGWGVTVVGYDVTDLYVETFTDASHVTFNGQPVQVQVYPQTLTVRHIGSQPTQETLNVVVVPHHGPLLQSIDATHAISVRWTGHELTNEFRALRNLYSAANVDAAFTALTDWGTGAQNFVLADDQGNIGYDPHALVPARPWAGTSPNGATLLPWLPLPGDGSAEWGYGDGGLWIPDAELPQAKNPAQGFLATANSDPVGVTENDNPLDNGNFFSFAFDDQAGIRIGRITELLQAKTANGGKVSVADMEAIQSDHAVILGRFIVPIIDQVAGARATDVTSAGLDPEVTLLDQWSTDGFQCPTGLTGLDPTSAEDTDATRDRDSAGCAYFHAFLRNLLTDLYADDIAHYGFEIDPQLGLKSFIRDYDPNTPAQQTTLCDDRTTTGVTESCDDIVLRALGEARDLLTAKFGASTSSWNWGAIHTVKFTSPLGLSGTSQYARPGGAYSVDVAQPSAVYVPSSASARSRFDYAHGPNERFVGEIGGATNDWQLPGYERDLPFTQASGLLADWLNNTYYAFPRTQADVAAATASTVTFKAGP